MPAAPARQPLFSRPICGGGCASLTGPGSITVDLARAVAPGEAIGVDLRDGALTQGRTLARERGTTNVTFHAANVYQLPYADGSFDAAFACAVLQHLATPLAALKELRRVLKPGGVIGIADGSSTITFRYPTNPILQAWDRLGGLEREYNTGRPYEALALWALLREAGFARTRASGALTTETGPPAGSLRSRLTRSAPVNIRWSTSSTAGRAHRMALPGSRVAPGMSDHPEPWRLCGRIKAP
jgi:SAM-dependent methyltransferase